MADERDIGSSAGKDLRLSRVKEKRVEKLKDLNYGDEFGLVGFFTYQCASPQWLMLSR